MRFQVRKHWLIFVGILFVVILVTALYVIAPRKLECGSTVDIFPNKDTVLEILLDPTKKRLEQVTIKIIEGRREYVVTLSSQDWVRLYSSDVDAIQVALLPRLLNVKGPVESSRYCELATIMEYTTGIPFEVVTINADGTSYSNKPFRYVKSMALQWRRVTKLLEIFPTGEFTLEDTTKIKVFTYTDFSKTFKPFLSLENVEAEGIYVEVYNATSKSGYATYWARRLKTLGFLISRVGNYPQGEYTAADVLVYVAPQAQDTYTVNILKKMLSGLTVQYTNTRPRFLLTTGEVVIILLR